jgi:hypothetical protein
MDRKACALKTKKERSDIGIVNDGVRNRLICFASTLDSPAHPLSTRTSLRRASEPPPSSTPSPTNMQLRLSLHPLLLVPETRIPPFQHNTSGLTIPPPRVHSETNSRAHHARTTRPTSHHITSHKHAVYDIPEVKRNTLVSHCASYIVYLAGAEPGCGYAARCTAVAVLQSGGRVHRHAVQGTKTGLLSIDFGELVVAVVAMAARSQDASLASMVNNPGLRGLCR